MGRGEAALAEANGKLYIPNKLIRMWIIKVKIVGRKKNKDDLH